jgi:hypothetical protein
MGFKKDKKKADISFGEVDIGQKLERRYEVPFLIVFNFSTATPNR